MSKKKAKAAPVEETVEQAIVRYWEKHKGTKLTHYLSFEEFKAGWEAAYAYNAE